jgi:hypothetical protein
MKTFGDLPEKDATLFKELVRLEEWFHEHGDTVPLLSVGKGLTCIGHDYYAIYMEEEGERLLKLANVYCPGYFKGPILVHIEKDKDFAKLINNLKKMEAVDVMISMGFEN